jgi:hypothetical protein
MPILLAGSDSMFEAAEKSPEKDRKHNLDFWKWAKRHPAATALGILVFAALCFLPLSPKHPSPDLAPDETPLFI